MDEQARLRELIVMQLGSQILQLCELQAKLDAVTQKLRATEMERDGAQASYDDLREKEGLSAT